MGIKKDIESLDIELARRVRTFLAEAKTKGLEIAIVETERTQKVQNAYFTQSREPLESVNKKKRVSRIVSNQ